MRQCGARGTAQLLRSSKFAGSTECARVRPNCKLNQPVNQPTKLPSNPQVTLATPFCIWQFDNNAGALLDTHTDRERHGHGGTVRQTNDCTLRLRLPDANEVMLCGFDVPRSVPRALPHDPSPLEYAIKSHTEDTTATGATLSEPMWQTDLVTIIYSYVPGCLSRPEQSHLGPTNPLSP